MDAQAAVVHSSVDAIAARREGDMLAHISIAHFILSCSYVLVHAFRVTWQLFDDLPLMTRDASYVNDNCLLQQLLISPSSWDFI